MSDTSNIMALPPMSLTRLGAEVSGPSLMLPEDMSREAWADLGKRLATVENGIGWWRADWYNFGEDRFKDFAQELDLPGNTRRTFYNNASVGRQYSKAQRERTWKKLSFTHHAIVAYQDHDLRAKLLDLAIQNDWSVASLAMVLRQTLEPAEEAEAIEAGSGAPAVSEDESGKYFRLDYPVTVKSIAAVLQDAKPDEAEMLALRDWIDEATDTSEWHVRSARLIRTAIAEAERYADLPGPYSVAAGRLANWIESQGQQEE